mgnify:CR=1 FL=1
MEFFVNYWHIILAFVAICTVAGITIYRFFQLPNEEQLNSVREWLVWAVTEAEKNLGSGTGQLKLRSVYDLFVARFGWMAKFIDFDTFSDMVDDALIEMRVLLSANEAVQTYVGVNSHDGE